MTRRTPAPPARSTLGPGRRPPYLQVLDDPGPGPAPVTEWYSNKLWAVTGNRIAVRFACEYHDDSGNWFRAYGNENWEFDENGPMRQRHASINDLPIRESDRKFHWDRSGPRPAEHPGLTDLGL